MSAKFQVSFTDSSSDPLKGLWFREEPGGLGAPVRFYYFHGDGNGLYRYGKIGYTNTNSYDYSTKGNTLTLDFRKTGASHTTPFRIEKENGQEWLILEDDPKEKGARYFKERQNISSLTRPLHPGWTPQSHAIAELPRLDGFMWIEATEFKTGGFGFAIYQFREAGIDGRGTGWFHQGDFNDWSTESLQFRRHQDKLEIAFELRPEKSTTQFSITTKDKKRFLSLTEDPRNFWHQRTFQEMGKSF
jgi:hypothetical protein